MAAISISSQLEQARKRKMDDRTLAQHAADMAQDLQTSALKFLSSDERTLLAALSRLVAEKRNRRFIRELCARVFHCADVNTQSVRLRSLIAEFEGIPNIFSTMGKLRLKGAAMAAGSLQQAAMTEVRRVFKSTFGELTLPTEMEKINRKLKDLRKGGLTPVLNPLVPEVFGKKTAEKYMRNLESVLTKQEDAGVVVQPWRLCPMLSAYAPEQGARELSAKLNQLLLMAKAGGKQRRLYIHIGTSLTMNIVAEALKATLSQPEHYNADVMLELPAYLTGSQSLLRELLEWATERLHKGAAPLRIAIVKGSHLAEEQRLAYLYGSEAELCNSKLETDTRFKQLLHLAIKDSKGAIIPVVGTHNYFDLSYALLEWARNGHRSMPAFVVTAGLGNHIGRMMSKMGADVTVDIGVTAAGGDVEFEHFLLTLLNEISRPDGILCAGYAVDAKAMAWGRMRQQFLASMSGREDLHRQNKDTDTFVSSSLKCALSRAHVDSMYDEARKAHEREVGTLPLLVDGKEYDSAFTCVHRSLTVPGLSEYRFKVVDFAAVNIIMERAEQAKRSERPAYEERCKTVLRLARELDKKREALAGIMARDAGYTMADADEELRNAIDACRYYVESSNQEGLMDGTKPQPLGIIVIAPSMQHPLFEAINAIAAAWVAGNVMIYKPPMHAMLLGTEILRLLRDVGLSESVLQFVPCMDNQVGLKLTSDPRVDGVITTAHGEEMSKMAKASPARLMLAAHAGEVTAYLAPQCDWRLAVKDITAAAFSRSGQGCCCPHTLVVHASLYDNQHFMNALRDAASSYSAHPGWLEDAQMGPLSHTLSKEELATLSSRNTDEGAWLVQPAPGELASQLWTPGIRTAIPATSDYPFKLRDLPVLCVIRTEDSAQAAQVQNRLSKGQMAIIYTQDEQELQRWRKLIRVGNIGINCCPRMQPGLVPYGGWGKAAWGESPKVGGPNFITALSLWKENARPQNRGKQRNVPFAPWETLSPKPGPDDFTRLTAAADSISFWWENEFGIRHQLDPKPGETTELSYHAVPILIRAESGSSDIDLSIALMAALRAGCEVEVSCEEARPWMQRVLLPLGVILKEESRDDYVRRFAELAAAGVRVRDIAATPATHEAAAANNLCICTAPVVANGRLELLHCLRELVLTRRTSRFGSLHDDAE